MTLHKTCTEFVGLARRASLRRHLEDFRNRAARRDDPRFARVQLPVVNPYIIDQTMKTAIAPPTAANAQWFGRRKTLIQSVQIDLQLL